MPLLQVETSLRLTPDRRRSLLRAAVERTAACLGVGDVNVRASYVECGGDACYAIGITPPDEPWVVVYANIKAGRSAKTKHAFSAALFDVLARELRVERAAIRILIRDYAAEDWKNGGD